MKVDKNNSSEQENVVKGYKCFNSDLTCRNFQFELGKTYKHIGTIGLCTEGFHFCKTPSDIFNYYSFSANNRVCEVEATDDVIHGTDKSVTNNIKIIKELRWNEVLNICNSGDCNSGYYNSGDYNSGVFCTESDPSIRIFDKEFNMSITEWRNSKYHFILNKLTITQFINENDMTNEEKIQNENFYITKGYLKTYTYKEAWLNLFNKLSKNEVEIITQIPSFDKNKFESITSIKIDEWI